MLKYAMVLQELEEIMVKVIYSELESGEICVRVEDAPQSELGVVCGADTDSWLGFNGVHVVSSDPLNDGFEVRVECLKDKASAVREKILKWFADKNLKVIFA